jgi:hypothetical protein
MRAVKTGGNGNSRKGLLKTEEMFHDCLGLCWYHSQGYAYGQKRYNTHWPKTFRRLPGTKKLKITLGFRLFRRRDGCNDWAVFAHRAAYGAPVADAVDSNSREAVRSTRGSR